MPFFGKAPRPGGKRKRADPAHTVQRRAGKARKERMVTHMSVKLRERPVVRKAMRTGVPQRLLPLAFQLCAALLGWLGAGAPLLGGLRPLGLCFAAAVPTPYAVCAAAGAAAGYAFALPLADAAPYLAGAAVVALVQLARAADRQKEPALSDLKGGSDIEADADGVIFMRPQKTGEFLSGDDAWPVEAVIAKNRHGGVGRLRFNWQPQYHNYVPTDNTRR